ncbi:hypothetical protein CUU54_02490 [Pectobacterium polaris]|uniref:hypothetical protein n=1 Tax=Pectobacterium polaris TaxID=2042057 RepID=UPI000D6045DC|nr:hypothetical protein [Pectobacterium polaris]MCU1787726.1 hypothetical protein [Pectobacterium polaris]PWD54859.1 hypothetical protein DF209_21465 [Pectobacterium polaris]
MHNLNKRQLQIWNARAQPYPTIPEYFFSAAEVTSLYVQRFMENLFIEITMVCRLRIRRRETAPGYALVTAKITEVIAR